VNISNQQKDQIIKNFFLLWDNFLPDKKIKKNISILFQEQNIQGRTLYNFTEKKFTIYFWNQDYKSSDFLLKVVAHEFAHVIFFLSQGEHIHSPLFFSYVKTFWDWLKINLCLVLAFASLEVQTKRWLVVQFYNLVFLLTFQNRKQKVERVSDFIM